MTRSIRTFFVILFCFVVLKNLQAADNRELLYNFEIRTPNHAPKPKLEPGTKERIEEKLTRGLVAVPGEKQVYLSWRLLKSDPAGIAFNVYRSGGDNRTLLNSEPIKTTADFLDLGIEPGKKYLYEICPIYEEKESPPEATVSVTVGETLPFHSIRLRDRIVPNRVAVGDLNGDGHFDFVVLHPNSGIDPAGQPNKDGVSYKLDAYLHDGTFLWRYDLGPGIEPGVWYSPIIVYDFDGDGKAEVALKIAENVERLKDGPNAGRVFDGPEHLGIIDGMSGKLVAKVDWPSRTPRLGDYNRTNRNQISEVRTRSVPAQEKPYKPLLEITKNQPEFDLGTVEGDVVGFRLPPYVNGINVPGYHLHFLSADRKQGGHLLNLKMENGSIKIAESHRFQVVLPERIAAFSEADLSKDRSEELEKVEK